MSKQKRTFVVRGFDPKVETFFQPTGVIEDKSSFKEITTDTQAQAVVTMLTELSPMVTHVDPKTTLSVFDLKITLGTSDKQEVRDMKTDLREVLKRWAEKSRVKNRRGYRANAIRTPVFEYMNDNRDTTVVRTQVILSNTIVYSDTKQIVSAPSEAVMIEDVGHLTRELGKRLDGLVEDVSCTIA